MPQKPETRYQFCEQFHLNVDSLSISRIVLCADQLGAELFLEKVFPHYNDCFVASADRVYPKIPELNAAVFSALEHNPKLIIVVFGADALSEVPVISERILVMDSLIADSYSKSKIRWFFRREVNEFTIVHHLISFFDQWKFKHRGGHQAHQYRNFPEYDREAMGWLLDLIAPKRAERAKKRVEFVTENIDKMVFQDWR